MANEIRGILSEVVLEQALNDAIRQSGIKGMVHWNVKPQQMSIEPDFTIGENQDAPTHVVLVTSIGSSRNAEMKSWRNLAELQEVKAHLPRIPKVINVLFKSNVKKGVTTATRKLYDVELHIQQKPYGKRLLQWIDDNVHHAAKDQDARRQLLQTDLDHDLNLKNSLQALSDDLMGLFQEENKELVPLWELMRRDSQVVREVPDMRKTTVRRGLGKLSVLSESSRSIIYQNYKKQRIPSDALPDYAFRLNFFSKTIGGAVWSESGHEIRDVIHLLGPKTCEDVLQICPNSMLSWITPLRNLDRIQLHVDYIENHYDEMIQPETLHQHLKLCYDDPAKLSGHKSDNKNWLYEIIVSLIKTKSGKLQGYGIAKIAEDANEPELAKGFIVLSTFANRKKPLSKQHLQALSNGLSKRFKSSINYNDINQLRKKVEEWVIKENLEDRLIPYRNFEPLLWLLEVTLKKHGITYETKRPWIGWLNEYSGTGPRSATTPFVRIASTLVHWKTATDAGKVHKVKELSARGRNVRYQYQKGMFSHREGIHKFFLIIDGTFTEKDLTNLSRAGWDRIFYADQMDELVQAIN